MWWERHSTSVIFLPKTHSPSLMHDGNKYMATRWLFPSDENYVFSGSSIYTYRINKDGGPNGTHPRPGGRVYKGTVINAGCSRNFWMWRCIEHVLYWRSLYDITCPDFLWILFSSVKARDRPIKSLPLSGNMIHHFPERYACNVCATERVFINGLVIIAFIENVTLKLKSSFVMLHFGINMRVSYLQWVKCWVIRREDAQM